MTQEEAWLLKEKYGGNANDAFEEDRARLARGEPLAYVIGWVPFLDVRIALDSHPLIPRPETEYWTELMIQEMRTREKKDLHILDLCAGSGCIGIAVLHALMEAQVDFAEIEERHHPTIRKNLALNGIDAERAGVIGGDLFERFTQRYEYILANPPYIDPALDRTTPSVREFEPHEALYGGSGGLSCIQRLIAEAPRFLVPQGILVIEHEPEQSREIADMGRDAGFAAETRRDQFGVERVTRLVLY
jgi:release factor glutamine methyltransferase